MKNKNILFLVGIVVILAAIVFYRQIQMADNNTEERNNKIEQTEEKISPKSNANKNETTEDGAAKFEGKTIYYYGEGCPHCKDVMAFLDANDIYSKVDFVKKEVWNNKENGKELTEAALKCGLNPSNIGVPFVYSEEKCYIGGPDVIDFFSKKAGIENK